MIVYNLCHNYQKVYNKVLFPCCCLKASWYFCFSFFKINIELDYTTDTVRRDTEILSNKSLKVTFKKLATI